jgi:eukaryotic-like serine/threonine-protein kinase
MPELGGETTMVGNGSRDSAAPVDASAARPNSASSMVETMGTGAGRREPERLLARGDAVGRYLIVEMLGRGGMGVVYRAYDPDLDRAIALKMVRVDAADSTRERARLLREAQAMARLSHPNVITVHDVGILEGSVFVAMEYVEGTTLKAWLAERKRSWREILDAYLQAGRGIAAAHAAGIVHRDFKPDNAMIETLDSNRHGGRSSPESSVGRVRVLDFGLARATGQLEPSAAAAAAEHLRTLDSVSLDRSFTVEGAVMGTPAYMSPEQHVGAKVDEASDQFSFCVAVYEALHGHRPFAGDNLVSLAYAVTQGELQEPRSGHDVPKYLHRAIVRGLSTRAAQRFASMDHLLAELGRDPRRRRWQWGIAGAASCVLAGAVALAALDRQETALCTGADAQIELVWNEERRAVLAHAFTDTGVPFAQDSWAKVATVLDDTARSWVESHTQACRATRVTGEQSEAMLDLRMVCLDQRLRELDALVEHLVAADANVVIRSIDAVERLDPASSCDDTARLSTKMEPPSDPSLAEAVRLQEQVLADVTAMLRLGQFEAANEHITTIAEEILALRHPPLSARLLALQAKAQSLTGETRAAVETHQLALEQAIVSADDLHAMEVARELSWLVGYRLAEHDQGRRWLGIAHALLLRAGGDAQAQAELATTEGSILVGAGRSDEGIDAHDRAREYWERRDPEHPSLARILDSIGAAEVQRGNPKIAIPMHRRALEIKRAHYGTAHPETAASMRELANALSHTEAFEEALELQNQVMEIERRARGEHNERVATTLDDIGRSLRKLDRLDEAVEHHRRALEIWKQVLGDPHPSLAVSILNIGYTLNATGDFGAALVEFERALVTVQSSVGPDHPYAIYAHNASASALVDLKRWDDALAHVEAVLALENPQVDPTLLAETKFIGAHALHPHPGSSSSHRARARTLALEARDAYATDAQRWAAQIEKIDHWLEDHPG